MRNRIITLYYKVNRTTIWIRKEGNIKGRNRRGGNGREEEEEERGGREGGREGKREGNNRII